MRSDVTSPTSDLGHLFRGFLMGGADVIPGVSGGTMALVLGIYLRLVVALSRFDRHLLFDPYLSESLTKKYAQTDKPHVRMTRRAVKLPVHSVKTM